MYRTSFFKISDSETAKRSTHQSNMVTLPVAERRKSPRPDSGAGAINVLHGSTPMACASTKGRAMVVKSQQRNQGQADGNQLGALYGLADSPAILQHGALRSFR
jgi:hypothetical protein